MVADTADAPVWYANLPGGSLAQVEATIARGVDRYGWRGVIVDYVQKVNHRGPGTREREVAAIGERLTAQARKLDVALVMGAQLNRDAARRTGQPPRSSDLRESAVLEHMSDAVVLIYRPDHDDPASPRAGEADFIVDKSRSGPRTTVTVAAQLHLQRFKPFELEPDEGVDR